MKKQKTKGFLLEKKPALVNSSFIYYLCLFALLIFGLLFIIKSPEVLLCEAVVTTKKKPISIHNEIQGRISDILIEPKEKVTSETILAVMKNAANYERVVELKRCYEKIDSNVPIDSFSNWNVADLGEIGESYIQFKKAVMIYDNFLKHNNILQDIKAKELSVSILKQDNEYIEKQINYENLALAYKRNDLKHDSILFLEGYLLETKIQSSLLSKIQRENKVLNYEHNLKKNKLKIQELYSKIEFQQREFLFQKEELWINLKATHSTLLKNIALWENKYMISSTCDGTIEYTTPLSEGQYLAAASEIFSLVPDNNEFICYAYLPSEGASKVQMNQAVNIKLNAYPFQEFGIVEAEVASINLSQKTELGTYLVEIRLRDGLVSTQGINFDFSKSMDGIVEIILEEKTLFQKIIEKSLKIMAPQKIQLQKEPNSIEK